MFARASTFVVSHMRLLSAALLLALAARAAHADPPLQPLVVISCAGQEGLDQTAGQLAAMTHNSQVPAAIRYWLGCLGWESTAAAVDRQRPWGAVLLTDGIEFPFFAFLPVRDTPKFLEGLQEHSVDVEEMGANRWLAKTPDWLFFLHQAGPWLLVSTNPENLPRDGSDPARWLGDLPQRYPLAARIRVSAIPQPFPQMFARRWQAAVRQQKAPSAAAGLLAGIVDRTLREQVAQMGAEGLQELETITLGLTLINPPQAAPVAKAPGAKPAAAPAGWARLEVTLAPRAGTHFSHTMSGPVPVRSELAPLSFSGALFSAESGMRLPADDRRRVLEVLQDRRRRLLAEIESQLALTDDQIVHAKAAANGLCDALQATARDGVLDGHVLIRVRPQSSGLLGGLRIADGKAMRAFVTQFLELVQTHPGLMPTLEPTTTQVHNVHLHQFHLAPGILLSQGRDAVTHWLGKKIDVALAVGDTSCYLAVGGGAVESLQQALAAPPAPASTPEPAALGLSLAASPAANLVAQLGDRRLQLPATLAASMLTAGHDQIALHVDYPAGGQRFRLDVEDGLLKILSLAAALR